MKLSDRELAVIEARAGGLGINVQQLMVEAAMEGSASTVTDRRALLAEVLDLRRMVGILGNNVNQIARVANATGRVPEEVSAAAAATARVLDRLDGLIAELPGGKR